MTCSGFEKDVFRAVLDYFNSTGQPLTTTGHFSVLSALLARCDLLDEVCDGRKHTTALEGQGVFLKIFLQKLNSHA